MTALRSTEPEPLCDIEAQFAALLDPQHPKCAVWLSGATPRPRLVNAYTQLFLALPAGTLYATEALYLDRLIEEPTEEVLSELLGYIEPKSAVMAKPAAWYPVIQARNRQGGVVWEQLASWERLGEALRRAAQYGFVAVLTLDEVIRRRLRLIALENAHAEGIEGRPGRGEAEARVPRRPARGLRHAQQGKADARQQTD